MVIDPEKRQRRTRKGPKGFEGRLEKNLAARYTVILDCGGETVAVTAQPEGRVSRHASRRPGLP